MAYVGWRGDGSAVRSPTSPDTYLVGLRYGHHARHSGYEAFGRHVASSLDPPIRQRYRTTMRGWRVDKAVARVFRRPYYSLALLRTELAAVAHMTRHRGAVYHVLYGDTDVCLLGRVRRLLGTRVVATFHEPEPGLEWIQVDDRVLRHVDRIVLMSETQRPWIERFVEPERVSVVLHGVDTAFFTPAEVPRERFVLTVGAKFRDWDTFTGAVDRLLADDPRLRVVGVGTGYGPDDRLVDDRIELRSGLSDEELRDLYRRAGAVVFALHQSTANNGLLEAMACGAPVVVSDVGGVREYVPDGAALVVPPGDPTALALATQRALDDPGLALDLGAAAREAVRRLDLRLVAGQMADVYRACAS